MHNTRCRSHSAPTDHRARRNDARGSATSASAALRRDGLGSARAPRPPPRRLAAARRAPAAGAGRVWRRAIAPRALDGSRALPACASARRRVPISGSPCSARSARLPSRRVPPASARRSPRSLRALAPPRAAAARRLRRAPLASLPSSRCSPLLCRARALVRVHRAPPRPRSRCSPPPVVPLPLASPLLLWPCHPGPSAHRALAHALIGLASGGSAPGAYLFTRRSRLSALCCAAVASPALPPLPVPSPLPAPSRSPSSPPSPPLPPSPLPFPLSLPSSSLPPSPSPPLPLSPPPPLLLPLPLPLSLPSSPTLPLCHSRDTLTATTPLPTPNFQLPKKPVRRSWVKEDRPEMSVRFSPGSIERLSLGVGRWSS